MKPIPAAAACVAILASACSPYHHSQIGHAPSGVASTVSRAVDDPSLAQRYPARTDIAHSPFPEGSLAPAARHPAEAWGVPARQGWKLTPLEREAEKRTIARGLPHAAVEPWGPAAGHRR